MWRRDELVGGDRPTLRPFPVTTRRSERDDWPLTLVPSSRSRLHRGQGPHHHVGNDRGRPGASRGDAARASVTYRTAGQRSGAAAAARDHELVGDVGAGRGGAAERHFRIIAPDLLGHGASATPRGDYSLGAHASGVRDLLTALGHDRVTVVGHSLGGGIAMQFAYQFPERCERLVLVSSGGLGREVHLLLRAAALPGRRLGPAAADVARRARRRAQRVGAAAAPRPHRAERRPRGARARLRVAGQRRLAPGVPAHGARRSIDTGRPARQRQRPPAPRAVLPTLIVWGERDSIIPRHPRHRRARGDARQPARGLPRRRPHAAPPRPATLRRDARTFCAVDRRRPA